MPRPRKDYKPLNVKLDSTIMSRFERYCDAMGQTKTTALERILVRYMDEYDTWKSAQVEVMERRGPKYG